MATIYITDETREMLDRLAVAGKRGISDQVGYLAEKEVKELGILPTEPLPFVGCNCSKTDAPSQGKN